MAYGLSGNIRCPYWQGATRRSILCEGCVEGSSVRWTFACDKDKQQQEDIFCAARYQYCEMAQLITHVKYGEEEEP